MVMAAMAVRMALVVLASSVVMAVLPQRAKAATKEGRAHAQEHDAGHNAEPRIERLCNDKPGHGKGGAPEEEDA